MRPSRFFQSLLLAALVVLNVSACSNSASDPGGGSSSASEAVFNDYIIDNAHANQAVFSKSLNDFVYVVMKDLYLWNDKVPQNLTPSQYAKPEDMLAAAKYTQEDRFTALVPQGADYINYLNSGDETTWGLSVKFKDDNDLRVAQVEIGSPAEQAGLKRGMQIRTINGSFIKRMPGRASLDGLTGNDVQIGVLQADSSVKTYSMTRQKMTVKTVLRSDALTVGGKKVGYLVFTAFLGSSPEELNSAFSTFKAQGVSELILDLRYNGGGSLATAQALASLIAPQLSGKTLTRVAFNDRYKGNNGEMPFTALSNGLNLTRVVVIISGNTASASELVINGLKPFIQVVLVGSTSVGKNVGSYTLYHSKSDYLMLPICFGFENALGDRSFGNGFTPNRAEEDDLTRDFGDAKEKCLAASVSYIEKGAFPKTQARAAAADENRLIRLDGRPDVLPVLVGKPFGKK